jgi:hypothetical protein
MDGLARCGGEAVEQGGEIGGIGVFRRLIARRAVANDAAALPGADDGQGRRPWMGAALGAARDVYGDAISREGNVARELGGKGAGSDQAMRAKRRPRAGGDAAARIGSVRDEAEALGRNTRCLGLTHAERSEQERAVGRGPHPICAIRLGDAGKRDERVSVSVTECKPETECEGISFERVPADRMGALRP